MPPHLMMPGDKDAVKGVELQDGTVRRVWTFARPYRATIIVFLVAILAAALLALVPLFAFRSIIDNAIPAGDKQQIAVLAVIAAARRGRRCRTRHRAALDAAPASARA